MSNLSTETFLWCLKRSATRRGIPCKFLSDNGTTFKAAAKVLSLVFKDPTVQEYLADVGSQWIFNIKRAPWWGDVFERMVKSTKMVGRANFSRDELLTAVVEIEAVINSRPLTYISRLLTLKNLLPLPILSWVGDY